MSVKTQMNMLLNDLISTVGQVFEGYILNRRKEWC